MGEVIEFLESYSAYFLIGLTALGLILLVCNISLSRKLAKLNKKRNAKLDDGCVGSIVDCITDQSNALSQLETRFQELSARNESLSIKLESCMQNVGIVRFNAFEDVGGE